MFSINLILTELMMNPNNIFSGTAHHLRHLKHQKNEFQGSNSMHDTINPQTLSFLWWKGKKQNAPSLRNSIDVSNSWPAAIRRTTLLMPEWRVGSVSKAFPYLASYIKETVWKTWHICHFSQMWKTLYGQTWRTNSRPGLCWTHQWTLKSWTCPCRCVHTGSRRLMPPCSLTPQLAEFLSKPFHDLRADSS